MLAIVVFIFAIMSGKEGGFFGWAVGSVIGIAMVAVFYSGSGAFFKLIERCAAKWAPGFFEPPRSEKIDSLALGNVLGAVYLLWIVACCTFAYWLTSVLVQWWH